MTMQKSKLWERVLVLSLIVATLYGTSYQQFRHFHYADPRGLGDSHSYVAMARGDWNVSFIHRYRFMIPSTAGWICRALRSCDVDTVVVIFYVINFCIAVATAMLFYLLLGHLGFKRLLALVGVLFFITSRITVLTTAAPLVDSLYYLSIVIISYLLVARRFILLLTLYPCLILTKETVIPFLLLPFFSRELRSWRNWGLCATAIAVSIVGFGAVRNFIDVGHAISAKSGGISHYIAYAPRRILSTAHDVLSFRGLHDIQSGFSLLLPMAAAGFYLNRRQRFHDVPSFLWVSLPIAVGFALVSGNLGRMLFASFILVIPYALVLVEHLLSDAEPNDSAGNP